MNLQSRIRLGVDIIEPYVAGITDDEIRRHYGLKRVIKLNANENVLGPSPLAVRAIETELATLHLYPDGTSEGLRDAIARFHQVSSDQVFVGNGSDEIIKLISETFLDSGDEIIVPHPSFSQYGFGAAVMRASVRYVNLKPDFTYDVDALISAVSERTKILYLCSPNNPTGTILRDDELSAILDVLPEHVLVVLDFAYNDYTQNGKRARETRDVLNHPQVVVLHTFSKLYGLAGLRLGYALGSKNVFDYVHRVREPFNVNRVAQRAGVAALEDDEHRRKSQLLAQEAKQQFETLGNHGFLVVPTEGNFVLVKTGDAKKTLAQLMEQGIMVRGGFRGLEDYVRITFGYPDDNAACIEALKNLRRT